MTTRGAFTILEVMVAMAILAIGLMASSSAMFTASSANEATQSRDLALMAIESTLEDILTNPFIQAETFQGAYGVPGLEIPLDDPTRADVLIVTVDQIDGDPDVLRISLNASWDFRDSQQTMTVVYIHTNRGG